MPCYLVPANELRLRSVFGVSLTMYWHSEKIAKAVSFERGAENVQGMPLFRQCYGVRWPLMNMPPRQHMLLKVC